MNTIKCYHKTFLDVWRSNNYVEKTKQEKQMGHNISRYVKTMPYKKVK